MISHRFSRDRALVVVLALGFLIAAGYLYFLSARDSASLLLDTQPLSILEPSRLILFTLLLVLAGFLGAAIYRSVRGGDHNISALVTHIEALASLTGNPLLQLDQAGRLLNWSKSAEIMFGFKAKEAIGRHFTDLCIFESSQAAAETFLKHLTMERADELASVGINKHAHLFHVSIRAKKLFNALSKKPETTLVLQNEQNLRDAEAAEQRAEAEFSEFLEKSSLPIIGIDQNHIVTVWNQAVATMTGMAGQQMLSRKFDPRIMQCSEKLPIERSISDTLQGIEVENFACTFVRPIDDHTFHLLLNMSTRRDTKGDVSGALIVATDLTPLRTKEKVAQESQALASLGQLTGGIAHDFNNLLTVIQGNLTLLIEDKDTLPASDFREIADDALSATRDGADLTKALLAFARQQRLEPLPLSLNALATRASRVLQTLISKNIKVSVTTHGSNPTALVDPGKLESAVINLCFNARDALRGHKTGTIGLVVDEQVVTEENLAKFDNAPLGHYVTITVTDNGPGIPTASLSRVFEPFWTTKKGRKGAGLGLSMVQGFVAQSGGFIQILSTPDVATSVTIYLPRIDLENPSPPILPAADLDAQTIVEDLKMPRVLVVEDEPGVRLFALRCLTSLGYSTVSAESAAKALEILTLDTNIDIVFSDIVMPGQLSGRDLARLVSDKYPHIKVLLTSGYENLSELVEADATQILKKPYDRSALASTLGKLSNVGQQPRKQ
jgi:PAS domain S-box-containing protein